MPLRVSECKSQFQSISRTNSGRFLLNNERGEPLQISRTSLQRLLTFHQVSPTFLDILGDYRGTWSDERELRSTSFRTSMIPLEPPKSAVIPSLFRTGRRYQMSFDLKIPKELKSGGKELKSGGKELKSGEKEIKSGEKELKSGGKFYKVRQVALHHQFDVESGVQLWIVGDPYGLVKNRVQGYLPMKGCTATFGDLQASFRSSLEIHLEILGMAAEMWSQYTKDAEENVQDMVRSLGSRLYPLGEAKDTGGMKTDGNHPPAAGPALPCVQTTPRRGDAGHGRPG